MTNRSPWRPQRLLDESDWSLIPDIGLTTRVGWSIRALWLVVAALAAALRTEHLIEVGLMWLLGAHSLFYVTQRLGGREGKFGTTRVGSESTFYERLIGDSASILFLLIAIAAMVFGIQSFRSLWSAL